MKRGEIWTVSCDAVATGTSSLAVIVQEDRFDGTDTITLCAFTLDPTDAPLLRLRIEATARGAQAGPVRLMIDKLTTVPKARLGTRVGRLSARDIAHLNRALIVFLGLAGGPAPLAITGCTNIQSRHAGELSRRPMPRRWNC